MGINKAVLLTLVSSSLLAGSAFAEAGDGKRDRDRHFGGPEFGMLESGMDLRRMTRHLDLDDTQQEQVRNIMTAAQPEIQAVRENARANREALQALDAGDPEVQDIAASNGALATEATLLFARLRSDVHAVLTDEQRTKLAELKESRGNRAGHSPKKR